MKTKYACISRTVVLVAFAAAAASAASGQSLWTSKSGNGRESAMFSDRRARTVGDIVTVMVQESASVQASTRTKTDKSANVEAGIDSFFFSPSASNALTHNGELPALDLGGTNDFTGGGEITNRQTVTARAAVTVIDVLPNGNLVIEGSRFVAYSGEKQYALLRGIIRPDDIQTGNTVLSSSIANARVEFVSQGSISATQRKGWLTRTVDTVNPF
jgi:flagellar L-ring protein precursor FlgH